MRKKLLILLVALLLSTNITLSGTSAASIERFSDVPSSKHYAEAVYELAERNIIGGYPDGTFRPSNSITRGQAAAIIAKMIKLDTSNVKNPGFTDVSTANGYYKAIAAMAEKGIIGGYGDGRYGPNDPIKRGQMASILVKAFDLPRGIDISNPFKDVDGLSHSGNILIIYQHGITTGTSPDTFSPNAAITRGQAAKMLKATEEVKPLMVTLEASYFNWDRISGIVYEEANTDDLFKAIVVNGKPGYTEDKIQLVPLKEGTGKLNLKGLPGKGSDAKNYKKYYVHIKKVNGELELTLEETEDFLPTAVTFYYLKEKLQNISLSTMTGEKLSDSVPFKQSEKGNNFTAWFDIDKPGQYIATLRFEDGKEVRYGIEVKQDEALFYYDVRMVKEQLSAVHDEGAAADIGKHKILTKDAGQIATITRDPGTNLFRAHAAGQKDGNVVIEYDRTLSYRDCDATDCYSGNWKGLNVEVQRIGSIVNVSIERNLIPDH